MELIYALLFIAFLLLTGGIMIGMLFERKKQTSLFNGNVLITSQVEKLFQICKEKGHENRKIEEAISLLSQGFSPSEINQILK